MTDDALRRIWHWLRGHQGNPYGDADGQVYCTECGRFIYG